MIVGLSVNAYEHYFNSDSKFETNIDLDIEANNVNNSDIWQDVRIININDRDIDEFEYYNNFAYDEYRYRNDNRYYNYVNRELKKRYYYFHDPDYYDSVYGTKGNNYYYIVNGDVYSDFEYDAPYGYYDGWGYESCKDYCEDSCRYNDYDCYSDCIDMCDEHQEELENKCQDYCENHCSYGDSECYSDCYDDCTDNDENYGYYYGNYYNYYYNGLSDECLSWHCGNGYNQYNSRYYGYDYYYKDYLHKSISLDSYLKYNGDDLEERSFNSNYEYEQWREQRKERN